MPVRQSTRKGHHDVHDFKRVQSVSIFCYSWDIKGMREQSKHSHLGDGWSTHETKPQNTANEQSIIGRKITSGLLYLKRRNINHTTGLIAMCTGVIMSRAARTAPSLPPWAESYASRASGQKSRESVVVLVLLPSPAQSCPVRPVQCPCFAFSELPLTVFLTPASSFHWLSLTMSLSYLLSDWKPPEDPCVIAPFFSVVG